MKQIKLPKGFPCDTRTAICISESFIVIAHPDARPRMWNFTTKRWNLIKPKFRLNREKC